MLKLAIFDLAGTVIDEQNIVYKTLHESIVKGGVSVSYQQVITWGAGKEKSQALRDILQQHDSPVHIGQQEAMYQYFLDKLQHAYTELEVKEMAGAEELFVKLRERKILIGFTTGYNQTIANQLIQKLSWKKKGVYDVLVTASDVVRSRPYPDMIKRVMELLGLDRPDRVIKIGDSTVDVLEGKNAGCKLSIGITTGAQTRAQLLEAGPDYILDHLLELLPIIRKI